MKTIRATLAAVLAGTLGVGIAAVATPAGAAVTYPTGYNTWACGNTSNRMVLTFDDAPGDHGSQRTYNDTIYMGAWLRAQGIRAMFFLTTGPMRAAGRMDVVDKLRAQGHYVGNHTVNHPMMTQISDAVLKSEVDGGVHGNMLRPPSGDYNAHDKTLLASWGYRVCTWNAALSTHDWDGGSGPRNLRSEQSIRDIVKAGKNASGGVVLGHLWTNFPNAVPGIIDDMHAAGKLFCRNTGPVTATVPYPLKCT